MKLTDDNRLFKKLTKKNLEIKNKLRHKPRLSTSVKIEKLPKLAQIIYDKLKEIGDLDFEELDTDDYDGLEL